MQPDVEPRLVVQQYVVASDSSRTGLSPRSVSDEEIAVVPVITACGSLVAAASDEAFDTEIQDSRRGISFGHTLTGTGSDTE